MRSPPAILAGLLLVCGCVDEPYVYADSPRELGPMLTPRAHHAAAAL